MALFLGRDANLEGVIKQADMAMYEAKESDCVKAVHRVWREGEKSSRVLAGVLP